MAVQKRCRSARRATVGRPGDRTTPRPARSERLFLILTATPSVEVLRRPLESAQYASQAYRAVLATHGLVPSMSRQGDCWDNAVAESFFATLEHELLVDAAFPSRHEAQQAIFECIAVWYNGERRHSTLGYVSPVQYEAQLRQVARAA